MGFVGLGKLGLGTAVIAKQSFGMRVIAWSENLTQEKADAAAVDSGLKAGDFEVVSKDALFRESDIVSVHYVLSERSRGLIKADDLAKMKPTAFIVNTSRGPLIDEDALLDVLKKGKIDGAALDVFDIEPLPKDSPWRTTEWGKNGTSEVVFTPHTGYSFHDGLHTMWETTFKHLQKVLKGEPLERRLV
jgi:lactate dehydrogenase-like 2-hydroxyacid dehydrogenase